MYDLIETVVYLSVFVNACLWPQLVTTAKTLTGTSKLCKANNVQAVDEEGDDDDDANVG